MRQAIVALLAAVLLTNCATAPTTRTAAPNDVLFESTDTPPALLSAALDPKNTSRDIPLRLSRGFHRHGETGHDFLAEVTLLNPASMSIAVATDKKEDENSFDYRRKLLRAIEVYFTDRTCFAIQLKGGVLEKQAAVSFTSWRFYTQDSSGMLQLIRYGAPKQEPSQHPGSELYFSNTTQGCPPKRIDTTRPFNLVMVNHAKTSERQVFSWYPSGETPLKLEAEKLEAALSAKPAPDLTETSNKLSAAAVKKLSNAVRGNDAGLVMHLLPTNKAELTMADRLVLGALAVQAAQQGLRCNKQLVGHFFNMGAALTPEYFSPEAFRCPDLAVQAYINVPAYRDEIATSTHTEFMKLLDALPGKRFHFNKKDAFEIRNFGQSYIEIFKFLTRDCQDGNQKSCASAQIYDKNLDLIRRTAEALRGLKDPTPFQRDVQMLLQALLKDSTDSNPSG